MKKFKITLDYDLQINGFVVVPNDTPRKDVILACNMARVNFQRQISGKYAFKIYVFDLSGTIVNKA